MMSQGQAEVEDGRWVGLPMLQLSERWDRRGSVFL